MTTENSIVIADIAKLIREDLEQKHGPLMSGATLLAALGYPSPAALRQARRRGNVPVPMFNLPGRRGYFCLTREVADWLAKARASASSAI